MVTKHNAYDVQLASKTNPAARYVLATDYAKLEAENAELLGERNSAEQELYAANATINRLREVFLRICKGNEMSEAIDDMDAILYPTPDNDNGN